VYFSGAKRRVAFSEHVCPTKRRSNHDWDLLLTNALLDDETEHETGYHAGMLRFLGVAAGGPQLELWPSDGDRQFAAGMLAQHGLTKGRPVVALGIGAGERKRVWPLKRFLAVADWLRRERDALILLVGGAMEAPAALDFARAFGSGLVDVVGRATLRETAALLEECELYVGNDTGVMHMAVAAGAMVVEISCHPQDGSRMHNNSPVRFGPVGVPSRVLQPREAIPPCGGFCQSETPHCIEGVSVEAVQQAVEALFASAYVRRCPAASRVGGTRLSENRSC
jgi:heptosyltransferase-2